MLDKNNIEIKTGDVVRISGAYFKNDNGLYYVEHSPGDPNWLGSDHSLRKLNKNGTLSKAKYNICFWPISITTNSWEKRALAREHNKQYAEIEIIDDFNKTEIIKHFEEEASNMNERLKYAEWHFGKDSIDYKLAQKAGDFYSNVAKSLYH